MDDTAAKEDPSPSPSPPASPPSTATNPNPNPNTNPYHNSISPNSSPKPDPAAEHPPRPPPGRSPSLPLPSAAPAPLHTSAPGINPRRLPPPCWIHEETLALIDSYREKWYALRRGNLRVNHWQEVAEGVGRRCQHLVAAGATKPKTAVQCRHKIEKLRKRYRSERQRALRANPVNPPSPSWVYFSKMDAMELGASAGSVSATAARPLSSARPKSAGPPSFSSDVSSPDEEEEEEEEEEEDDDDDDEEDDLNVAVTPSNTRSLHGLMLKANGAPSGAAGRPATISGLRFRIPKAVRSKVGGTRAEERASVPNAIHKPNNQSNGFFKGFPGGARTSAAEEMRKRLEKRRKREREGDLVGEMVTAVKMLGDGFVRMEEMKMEMAREMEKLRMEMELKRTEMILESQRRIVDAFVRGIRGKKRAKVMPESS